MAFECQRNSYLKEFETKVKSCAPLTEANSNFAVLLEDTILFPEGGGQPDDFGFINGIPVKAVKRDGNKAVHYVDSPLAAGDLATVKVDWPRRFDHMQQHTGQHLLTAIAVNMFGYNTTSWNLGKEICYVELDIPSIKMEEIQKLEEVVNQNIRACLPVKVCLCEKNSPELNEVRRGLELPDDYTGPVRIIEISGIDRNTCCGTHVKNTSELQVIKLLYAEKGKKKKTNLFFIVGQRVLNYVAGSTLREKALNNAIGSNSENMVEMVKKLQKSLKLANKNALLAYRELATIEAKMFNALNEKPEFFFLHKKNAEAEFMSIFLSEVTSEKTLFFLTVGDNETGGQFVLSGPEDVLKEYGPLVCKLIEGKGSLKNGRFQGKFCKGAKLENVENLLKNATKL